MGRKKMTRKGTGMSTEEPTYNTQMCFVIGSAIQATPCAYLWVANDWQDAGLPRLVDEILAYALTHKCRVDIEFTELVINRAQAIEQLNVLIATTSPTIVIETIGVAIDSELLLTTSNLVAAGVKVKVQVTKPHEDPRVTLLTSTYVKVPDECTDVFLLHEWLIELGLTHA